MISIKYPEISRRFKEWQQPYLLKSFYFDVCFRDPAAPSTSESTSNIIQSLTAYLPDYMKVLNSQVLPQNQAQLQAAQQVSPAYTDLLTKLYASAAPKLAQTGSQVENINRLGAANTDLQILQGPGGQLATEAQKIDRTLNPEFYSTREAEASKLGQLLSSIDLNNANPEAERLVNQENIRSGNSATPSATNTVSNALSFGGELQKRRDALGQALSTATNFLQPSQGQFNPVVTALNRPSQNTGETKFNGITNPSDQAYAQGNSLMGQISQLQQQRTDVNSQRRDALDRINETTSSLSV
jgi:hypothetical protein